VTTDAAPVPPAETPLDPRVGARADLRAAGGWIVLGAAILLGSITMDRLEQQHINPYTIPGLVPGLLGIAMLILGTVLGVRSWRRGGIGAPRPPTDPAVARRLTIVIAFVVAFSVGLVGHGLPFWAAAAIFVVASILVLQAPQPAAAGRALTWRDAAFALAVGIGSGIIITFVFQELFLVRLP
jgi:hypothetical protein